MFICLSCFVLPASRLLSSRIQETLLPDLPVPASLGHPRARMLRSGLDLIAPSALSAAAALPALQLLRGGLQQRFASTTKKAKKPAAPAVQDAKKPKAKKEDKPAAKATSKDVIKRPPSGFNLYVKAHSGAISSGTAADRMKRLSQEWKTLSDTDKAPYQQQAAAAKSETAKAREAAKKPPTAYNLFFKEQYARLGGTTKVTEAAKQIGSIWKGLSDAEKQRYKAAAEPAIAAYKAKQSSAM